MLKKTAIIILIAVASFSAFVWCGKNVIPGGGEAVFESKSDNGEYELVLYYVPHSLSPDMLRGEIECGDRKARKIYWAPVEIDEESPGIKAEWIDEKTVQINGMTLDISKGRYDYRKSD